jgi:putative SOS response-associated peptidase YedK
MCGRKTLTKNMTSIIEEIEADEWAENFKPSYNIAPSQYSPIAIKVNDKRIIKNMTWGLIPSWSKNKIVGQKMINARSETILDKPSFQGLMKSNRCIVIADGYFEWNNQNGIGQPYYIFHPEKKILPMAGLWTTWQSSKFNIIESYTIITTKPQKPIAHIHNRMPVIIENKMINEWINCEVNSLNSALNLLKP